METGFGSFRFALSSSSFDFTNRTGILIEQLAMKGISQWNIPGVP